MLSGRQRLILFPALLLLLAFLLDKAFYIGDIEDYFLRTASFVNYDHKEELIDELELYLKQPERRKVLVLFGNSRTLSFDNRYIEKNYPDWILFNFSVPGGTADYFLYYIERLARRNIRPDFISLAVTPQAYNQTARVTMDEVMLNGLSFSFVARYANHYQLKELGNYAAKKLFWNYQYRPKLGVIQKKLKKNREHLIGYRYLKKKSHEVLTQNRGSIPYARGHQAGKAGLDYLEKAALGTWVDFFYPYTLSQDQLFFTEECLKILKRDGIPHNLIWARVSPQLRAIKKEKAVAYRANGEKETVYTIWEPSISSMADKYGIEFMDLNYGSELQCDQFFDSSHMAAACFPAFTDSLLNRIKTRLSKTEL